MKANQIIRVYQSVKVKQNYSMFSLVLKKLYGMRLDDKEVNFADCCAVVMLVVVNLCYEVINQQDNFKTT